VCEGTTKDSVELSWELPSNNGGRPITGYVVETREIGSNIWTKYVSSLNVSTLTLKSIDYNVAMTFILSNNNNSNANLSHCLAILGKHTLFIENTQK